MDANALRLLCESTVDSLKLASEQGDEDSLWALYALSLKVVQALSPDGGSPLIRKALRESDVWPCLLFTSKQANDYVQTQLNEAGLGCEPASTWNQAQSLRSEGPVRMIAVFLHLFLTACRYATRLDGKLQEQTDDAPDESSWRRQELIQFKNQSIGNAIDCCNRVAAIVGSDRPITASHLAEIVNDAGALPPWEKATSKAWFEVAYRVVDALAGPEPQIFPLLRELGEYRVGHSGNSDDAVTNDYRDGVRTKLWQSFQTLGRNDQPIKSARKGGVTEPPP
jgi:hypothetical protein